MEGALGQEQGWDCSAGAGMLDVNGLNELPRVGPEAVVRLDPQSLLCMWEGGSGLVHLRMQGSALGKQAMVGVGVKLEHAAGEGLAKDGR
jgi:hypothetical protein